MEETRNMVESKTTVQDFLIPIGRGFGSHLGPVSITDWSITARRGGHSPNNEAQLIGP